jgi:hypothetical protein
MRNCSSGPAEPAPAGLVISLHITNQYELYPTVEVTITDTTIAACPIDHLPRTDAEAEAFADWAYDNIYASTGVGHTDGDSWYHVTVTDSSAPWLVGHTFDWGY